VENSGYFLQRFKVTSRNARWGWCLFLPLVGYSHNPLRGSRRSFITSFLFTISLLNPVHASIQEPVELATDSETATAGFFHLRWHAENYTGNWQLQEAKDADLQPFEVLYSGPDTARVISGKPDGIYYYRVVTEATTAPRISNTIKVIVAHHPLSNAFIFFGVGALIFLAILISIFRGNRNNIL
jgi:hypothetical protein